jgi:hypothetical protein
MVHRGIATLSGAMMFCFLILAGLDTQFFFLHFYESLIYLVIILMLFYFADHWAYMLGIMAPAVWILQQLVMGALWGDLRSVASYVTGGERPDAIDGVTLLIVVLAVMMIIFCVRRWRREFSGLGKFWITFAGSLVVTIVYYAIYWYWFGSLFPWK